MVIAEEIQTLVHARAWLKEKSADLIAELEYQRSYLSEVYDSVAIEKQNQLKEEAMLTRHRLLIAEYRLDKLICGFCDGVKGMIAYEHLDALGLVEHEKKVNDGTGE